jgi:hypothetical protein
MGTSKPVDQLLPLVRRIPPRWIVAILLSLAAYWWLQPIVNHRFGWQLPSLASLLQEPTEPTAGSDPSANSQVAETEDASASLSPSPRLEKGEFGGARPPGNLPTAEGTTSVTPALTFSREGIPRPLPESLTALGNDRYRSPAGLVYGRGSEHGHRLKHLARHLEDEPTRPGSHGVFVGDFSQVLGWIDEAYRRGQAGDRRARVRREEEMTIYEFTFEKSIGYVGGQDGNRRNRPSTARLRLVVSGERLITAFPY